LPWSEISTRLAPPEQIGARERNYARVIGVSNFDPDELDQPSCAISTA